MSWSDGDGNLWLFGGLGSVFWEERDFSSIDQYDLWKFNPSTEEWAWMSGNTTSICSEADGLLWCGQDGINGTLGTPAIGNIPSSRHNANTWIDTAGNLWLFGGYQQNSTWLDGGRGYCNDIWEYDPSANEWAWMNGNVKELANYVNASTCQDWLGSWGVLGTPAAGNIPTGRSGSASWTDHSGNFWIFEGVGSVYNNGTWATSDFNDLWVYQPVAPAPTPSFELIASPNPIDIVALGSGAPAIATGTTTVNVVVADGFDSPVTLTAANDTYNGVTYISGSFSPATITGAGSSTLTISVAGAAVPGATSDLSALTISATGGGTSQSIQVTVEYTDSDEFTGSPLGPSSNLFRPGGNILHTTDRDYVHSDRIPTRIQLLHDRWHHTHRDLPRLRQSDYGSVDYNVEGDLYWLFVFVLSKRSIQRHLHYHPGCIHTHFQRGRRNLRHGADSYH